MPYDLIITNLALLIDVLVLGGGMAVSLLRIPTPRMRTRRSLRLTD